MLQKKDYQQQQRYQQHQQKLMLQKKDYQQQIPTIPTKTNVTKQELPTTTIKKPIVENQTSGKIKTNVTKEGLPTTKQCYKRRTTNNNNQQ